MDLEPDFCHNRVRVNQSRGGDVRGGREWRFGWRGLELPPGEQVGIGQRKSLMNTDPGL